MKPAKPDNSDCCGSGCTPCIFDVYETELEKWEKGSCRAVSEEKRSDLLSTLQYRPFRIVSATNLTPDVLLYKFQPQVMPLEQVKEEGCNIPGHLPYQPGQHFIMRCPQNKTDKPSASMAPNTLKINNSLSKRTVNADSKFISRAYTPVSLACEEKDCCFDMIIKLYEKGTMSSILRDLEVGDVVHFRGPYGGFEHTPNSYSSLTMICAGTGIAPMISIIKSILRDESDETLILLLFSVTNFSGIILREEIWHFSRSWNVSAKIFLSSESNWEDAVHHLRYDEVIINKKITQETIESEVCSRKNNHVLLCGPAGFCKQMEDWLLLSKYDVDQRLFVF